MSDFVGCGLRMESLLATSKTHSLFSFCNDIDGFGLFSVVSVLMEVGIDIDVDVDGTGNTESAQEGGIDAAGEDEDSQRRKGTLPLTILPTSL